MSAPRIDQINVVVPDLAAATEFLRGLGLDLPAGQPGWEAWDAHHREVATAASFALDLDSAKFAAHWGGLDRSSGGVVVDVRVDERTEVDRLHELALSLGARSVKAPHDAFFGSRFALVEAPGPLHVGLMSVRDEAHRSAPPDLASFA